MAYTDKEKNALNNMCPVASETLLGNVLDDVHDRIDAIEEVNDYGIYGIVKAITADATGGVTVAVPFDCRVVDVIAESSFTLENATVKLVNGTTDVTNAIDIDTINVVSRAGTIDAAAAEFDKGDNFKLVTVGATAKAVVTILVRKR